ncbi:phosphotransferase [Oceaniserpentilla sp. 4NH20-0058]|uniref:aminoglycoside phosphotransferase family protein n=1 Tax=Oceaniserpentilla sp. 4NH20-0058 TaxID=3127660 RepID=UPI0031031706
MDDRQQSLQNWVIDTLNTNSQSPQGSLEVVSGDASFRRYFRQYTENGSYICVDAPPEKENSQPFLVIGQAWFEQGINVPNVIKADLEQGFMLLSDMGDQLLFPMLNEASAEGLYHQCFDAILQIQQSQIDLPLYDGPLLDREMALFTDWYLGTHLNFELTPQETSMLHSTFETLRESALGQIQVPVHRDFHSRNIMVLEDDTLGIIDFQDAVLGPLTYDLASLLRDCYVAWPIEEVHLWAKEYFAKAREKGIVGSISDDQLMLWFDWMGIQRHLKAVGIFARLNHRDGKTGYMNDIPRTLNYLIQVSAQYDSLSEFHHFLTRRLMPHLESEQG